MSSHTTICVQPQLPTAAKLTRKRQWGWDGESIKIRTSIHIISLNKNITNSNKKDVHCLTIKGKKKTGYFQAKYKHSVASIAYICFRSNKIFVVEMEGKRVAAWFEKYMEQRSNKQSTIRKQIISADHLSKKTKQRKNFFRSFNRKCNTSLANLHKLHKN